MEPLKIDPFSKNVHTVFEKYGQKVLPDDSILNDPKIDQKCQKTFPKSEEMRLILEVFTHCDLLKIEKQNRSEKKNTYLFLCV